MPALALFVARLQVAAFLGMELGIVVDHHQDAVEVLAQLPLGVQLAFHRFSVLKLEPFVRIQLSSPVSGGLQSQMIW